MEKGNSLFQVVADLLHPSIWVAISSSVVVFVLLLAVCVYCMKKKRKSGIPGSASVSSSLDSNRNSIPDIVVTSSSNQRLNALKPEPLVLSKPTRKNSVCKKMDCLKVNDVVPDRPPTSARLLSPLTLGRSLFTMLAPYHVQQHEVQPGFDNLPPFNSLYARACPLPKTIPETPIRTTSDLGTLHFSICYEVFQSELRIVVLNATNLPAKDVFYGTSDPYVELFLGPGKKQKLKTEVKMKCLNPVWNETFVFTEIAHDEVRTKTLYIDVYDFDRFSRNDALGATQVTLGSYELHNKPLQFTNKLHASKNSRGYLGDLLVSLCYNPVFNQITIVVMKCSHLRSMDVRTGKTDPYVKVNLFYSGIRTDKKKTKVKERSVNPIWNEVLEFDAPANKIRGMTFEFTLMDHNIILPNRYIGKVIIGYSTTGPALKHWTEIITTPNKPVASWHTICKY